MGSLDPESLRIELGVGNLEGEWALSARWGTKTKRRHLQFQGEHLRVITEIDCSGGRPSHKVRFRSGHSDREK